MSLCRLQDGNIVLKRFPGLGLPMSDLVPAAGVTRMCLLLKG